MGELLRWCRGVLGIGVTWGAAWGAIFGGLALIVALADPGGGDPGEGVFQVARIGAVFGFASGAAFAVLLSLGDGRKTLRDLSPGRAALWGMLGTAAYPLLTQVHDGMVFIVCPVGAALAAASVAVAKKVELGASTEPPKLAG